MIYFVILLIVCIIIEAIWIKNLKQNNSDLKDELRLKEASFEIHNLSDESLLNESRRRFGSTNTKNQPK